MASYEGLWDCPQCDRRGNRGLVLDCPGCGRKRPADVRFYLAGDAPELTAAAGRAGFDGKVRDIVGIDIPVERG